MLHGERGEGARHSQAKIRRDKDWCGVKAVLLRELAPLKPFLTEQAGLSFLRDFHPPRNFIRIFFIVSFGRKFVDQDDFDQDIVYVRVNGEIILLEEIPRRNPFRVIIAIKRSC